MTASKREPGLERLDATDQAALVRKGEITPRELVDAAIARIERLDPQLNAVILPAFDRARDLADEQGRRLAKGRDNLPPFFGVPFLMKDVVLLAASVYLLKQDVVRVSHLEGRAAHVPTHVHPVRFT